MLEVCMHLLTRELSVSVVVRMVNDSTTVVSVELGSKQALEFGK